MGNKALIAAAAIVLAAVFTTEPGRVRAQEREPCDGPQDTTRTCTISRVNKLRQTSALFKHEAAEPLPPELEPAQGAEAKRYLRWLASSALKLDQLATAGTGILSRQTTVSATAPHNAAVPGPVTMGGSSMGAGSQLDLLSATQQMEEMQMSFNLQYLQLQNQLQNENRQFTLLSDVLKAKQDTTKSSLGNLR